MACPHKFQNYLNLEKLDFEPTTLIVGTFNPAWPISNEAEWFYGRTKNNHFWEVLPRLYNEQSLINDSPKRWKEFCKKHKIGITDFISCIEDADSDEPKDVKLLSTYSDKSIATSFKRYDLVKPEELIKQKTRIRNVYLTRGAADIFWKTLWQPVEVICLQNNIRTKTLITPSGYAYFQQGRYNKLNPDNKKVLDDYILMRWQDAWHKIE